MKRYVCTTGNNGLTYVIKVAGSNFENLSFYTVYEDKSEATAIDVCNDLNRYADE